MRLPLSRERDSPRRKFFMEEHPSPNNSQGRRLILSLAVFLLLFVGGLGFLIIPLAEGGLGLPEINLGEGDVLRYVGYFLVADGLLAFFGGLIYMLNTARRVVDSPEAAELREVMRANLSVRATQEAERALQDLQKRVWQRGLVFMLAGLVSLAIAAALLSGLIG